MERMKTLKKQEAEYLLTQIAPQRTTNYTYTGAEIESQRTEQKFSVQAVSFKKVTDPTQITDHHILDLYQALALKNQNRPSVEPLNKDIHFSRRFVRKAATVNKKQFQATESTSETQNILDALN